MIKMQVELKIQLVAIQMRCQWRVGQTVIYTYCNTHVLSYTRAVIYTQWRTGSEFSTGHGELKGTLLFTNTEGFKCISATGALFSKKGALFAWF